MKKLILFILLINCCYSFIITKPVIINKQKSMLKFKKDNIDYKIVDICCKSILYHFTNEFINEIITNENTINILIYILFFYAIMSCSIVYEDK